MFLHFSNSALRAFGEGRANHCIPISMSLIFSLVSKTTSLMYKFVYQYVIFNTYYYSFLTIRHLNWYCVLVIRTNKYYYSSSVILKFQPMGEVATDYN